MKLHINYAAGHYLASQLRCGESALRHGFDRTIAYGPSDLDPDFTRGNRFTLSLPRGAGYWLWKPYVILKTLVTLDPADWLVYTDSGLHFIKDPWAVFHAHERAMDGKGVLGCGGAGLNSAYTKRDTFVLMGLDEPRYADVGQVAAAIIVCRNTPFARAFLGEWLAYARDPRILTDLPNTCGLPNHPGFIDHRHDQSIFTLLCLKHAIPVAEDITQFGMPEDPYVLHHRNRA